MDKSDIEILYFGSAIGTSKSRFDALSEQVKDATLFPFEVFDEVRFISGKLGRTLNLIKSAFILNILFLVKSFRHRRAIFWVDKGIWLLPPFLMLAKATSQNIFVQHNTDFLNRNGFKFQILYFFLRINAKYFHFNFSCNDIDISIFKERGCKIFQTGLGYDHKRFYPGRAQEHQSPLDPSMMADVVFIGHHEARTERYLRHVLDNGISMRIMGSGWINTELHKSYPEQVLARRLSDVEYECVLENTVAAIAIPSELNFNEFSGRTFEIPAMKTLLVAMDTPGHRTFFTKEEALFFNDEASLLAQLKMLLSDKKLARKIANKGYERCLKSGYSWGDLSEKELSVVINAKE
ncbi:glycosyltransferase [Alphaproteobacteria bacterium]|nr:glycosyltransferase [Alphaproteobacteria bacterium]